MNAIVIENSLLMQQVIVDMLKDDFNVHLAKNWEQASLIVKQDVPELVIVSNVLEGLSGYEICQEIRKNPKTATSVVFMISSLDSQANISKGFESGINDYLIKPFSSEEVKLKCFT